MPQTKEVIWEGPNGISLDEYDPRVHNKGGWWIEGEGFIPDGDYAQMTIKNILNKDSEEKKEWDRRCEEASKAYAKIPQWRWDYSVEDYERDCAEEERERARKRLRFTPPLSPSPEPNVSSTSNAVQQQNRQLHPAATQILPSASHQNEIAAAISTEVLSGEAASLDAPGSSDMSNVLPAVSWTAATELPISPASSKTSPLPLHQSKKRKRNSTTSTPPATRSMATRSRADRGTTFYELDRQSHSMIATVDTRGKTGVQKGNESTDKTETTFGLPSTRKTTSMGRKRGRKDAQNKALSSAAARRDCRVPASTKGPDPDRVIEACWRAGIRL